MSSLTDLITTYTHVVGGGGFGIVKTGIGGPYDKYAVKFLYASNCPSAKKEFIVNKFLYSAYEIFLHCDQVLNVSVVKPYDFISSNCSINCQSDKYDCAVIMERLLSPMADGYAVHLAFNGVLHESVLNKISYAKGIPRGYFFDPEHILTMLQDQPFSSALKSLQDITYRIGILDGICIFGARMSPVDAEYILTIGPDGFTVTMLDFGLFVDINLTSANYQQIAEEISQTQEYNIYYHPYSEGIPYDDRVSCKEAYIRGFTEAFECFDNETFRPLYDALLELYSSDPYV